MNKKIVITGATGFLGKKLTNTLVDSGNDITVLTRSIENAKKILPKVSNFIYWDMRSETIKDVLERKDIIIHLAGENIIKRMSAKVGSIQQGN